MTQGTRNQMNTKLRSKKKTPKIKQRIKQKKSSVSTYVRTR